MPLPTTNELEVNVALPVPPYVAPIAAAFHLPVVIPPNVVIVDCPTYPEAIEITLFVIVIVEESPVKLTVLDNCVNVMLSVPITIEPLVPLP